jgi:predicted 2-oxoglutarate/Fe(II)-dependent dioxygenase YbiX
VTMKVERYDLGEFPVLCIDDFLPNYYADMIFQEWLIQKSQYAAAGVFKDSDCRIIEINRDYRTNQVLNLPQNSATINIIHGRITDDECKKLWKGSCSIFNAINFTTYRELVVSRYSDGNFYKQHCDTKFDNINTRIITLIYYVNTLPKKFTGGELIISENDEKVSINPEHNRAVLFPSRLLHEVEKVSMEGDKWEDARFSLNYWFGFQT